jgi:hypothetical protein
MVTDEIRAEAGTSEHSPRNTTKCVLREVRTDTKTFRIEDITQYSTASIEL